MAHPTRSLVLLPPTRRVFPSVVQHAGTSSALFNEGADKLNSRFHTATNFAVRVAFPGFDDEGVWRRRRGRRRQRR